MEVATLRVRAGFPVGAANQTHENIHALTVQLQRNAHSLTTGRGCKHPLKDRDFRGEMKQAAAIIAAQAEPGRDWEGRQRDTLPPTPDMTFNQTYV